MSLRAEQKAATAARVLDAAAALIASMGTDAASIDAIARAAGVTSGAIYASYRNKAELLLAVAQHRTVSLPSGSVEGVASVAARTLDEFSGANPIDAALMLQLLAAAARDEELRTAMADRMSGNVSLLEQRLQAEGASTALGAADTAALMQVVAAGLLTLRPVLGDDFAQGLSAKLASLLFDAR